MIKPLHGIKLNTGLSSDVFLVIRFTRHWIHYGFLAHVAVCVLIAAIEGVLGK